MHNAHVTGTFFTLPFYTVNLIIGIIPMPSLSHSLENSFQNGGHETALTDVQHYSAIIANETSCIY